MQSNNHYLFLIIMILVSSCIPIPLGSVHYKFKVKNNSPKDIYIVIDNMTYDQQISPGSLYNIVSANYGRYIVNKKPWSEIVKDSADIYFLDASLIELRPLKPSLSAEICKTITQEMILCRITLHHEDFLKQFTLLYPSLEIYQGFQDKE